ncbi:PREDICTED: uncharacterized protein LOC109150160 [Ipomoea nil]|uniref:uncharacterized protein LOC109150160 n=1 Tax=Ipomoea nil TaxID=35883 RepID=UPI00090087B6|nr:PREDICTED: uncharacterized protein LOC109150160 [Ipomoea nil]
MNRLKMLYNQFSELIAHTGVTYNPSTNTVHACGDTWNKFYVKNPSKFKAFKRNGCKHYELMAEVFARSVATGGLAKSSSQRPPNSDEERDDEDEFLHSAKPSSFFTEGGTSSKGKRSLDDLLNVGGSTMKSGNKKLREQFGNALDTISMSISSKQIRRKAREDASMMSTAAMGNPYSMKACMDILNNMGDIPFKAVNACIQQWANPDIREAFIELRRPEWQRDWVLSFI